MISVFTLRGPVRIKVLALLAGILCTFSLKAQPYSGLYTVGGGGTFTSLTAAFTAINASSLTGPVILELQSGYSSAGETFPLSFPTNASVSNTITVQPAVSGLSVLNTGATATFALSGASYCIIDGRVGGTGTVRDLIIESSDVVGQAIALTNDASNNIFRYCVVKGANASSNNGVIVVGNGLVTGCDNNLIEYCDVTASSSTPRNCIFSQGISGADNSGNVVTNCNIYDFHHATAENSGVNLGAYNYNWLIEGSSFYQTSARSTTGTMRVIQASATTSGRIRVNSNFIGGSSSECGGSALTISGTSGVFVGIRIAVGIEISSIQGNTVQNINVTSSNASNVFSGIHIVTGNCYCGDTIPNLIGSMLSPNSLVFTLSGSGSTGPALTGIIGGLGTPGIIKIMNNQVGGLTVHGIGNVYLAGIFIQTSATEYTVSGNKIGSPLAPLVNNTNRPTYGINSTSQTANQIIEGNVIQNLVSASTTTGSITTGINTPGPTSGVSAGMGNFIIRNNIVRNLTSSCTYASLTSPNMSGIALNATVLTGTGNVIENNSIYGLYNLDPTQGVLLAGIHYNGPASGNHIINRNLIHSIVSQSNSTVSANYGISYSGSSTSSLKIYNNMIRLGIDSLGNSITVNPIIYGIRKSSTNGNMSACFNSIYIGGSGVNSGVVNSACLFRGTSSTTADSLFNNIFYNARSNSSSGGKHLALFANSPIGIQSNNNIYYVSGNGGILASVNGGTVDLTTVAAIQGAIPGYDLASLSSNPLFVAPDGTSFTVDLHLQNSTPAEGAGVAIPYVTVDYDNQTRSFLSPTDIGADAADFVNTSMSGIYTVGSGGDYLNLTGAGGFFDAINTHTVSGNITVNIISNLAEPGTIALNEWTEPASPIYTLTIQSGTATQWIIANTGDLAFAMIRLNGADRVTFTGGAGKYLRFINNHSVPASGQPVFLFGNSAVSCAITNCLVQSNASNPVNGVIVAASSGTNQLSLTGNEISDIPGVGYPATGVYSNNLNNSITVTNNSIFNWSAFGLNLAQTASSLTITGNSFYNNLPASATGDQTAIFIGANGNHGISNNFIGGSSASAMGVWTNTGIGSFVGLDLAFSGSGVNPVDGNVIRGINMTNPGASGFKGIHLSSGSARIGYTIGNTIGDTVAPNSITLNGTGSYYAIHEETANTSTSVDKNNIANIVLTGTSGTPVFYGIRSNVADISRNRIQKITCDQTGLTPTIYGIYNGCTDNLAAIGINNNMISISGGSSSNPVIYGYYDLAVSGTNSRLYFNTINIHGSATLNSSTFALRREGNSTLDLQNNIFSNKRVSGGSGKHYSVYAVTIFNWTSDYNNLYSSTGPLGFWGGLDRSDLVAWQTASNRDSHSVGGSPSFVSVDNLHLLTFTNCYLNSKGTAIGGITTDFDNETRGPVPDIGADEFSPVVPAAPTSWENKTACFGTPMPALTASGSGNMRWYSDPTLSTLVFTGNTFNTGQTAVGLHTYYVTNEVSGCESNMITVTLTIYALPEATASAVSTSVCAGNSIQLTGSASGGSGTGYIYAWGGPGGFTSSSQNPVYSNAQVAQSGSYMLTVTDSRNCISVPAGSVTIQVTERPVPNASALQAAVCTGSTLNLTGSASGGAGSPFTYTWSGPNGFSSTQQNPTLTNIQSGNAGTFYLTVTDVNSCASFTLSGVSVSVIPLPLVDAGTNQTIANGTNTSLTATASGGSGSYSYSWTPGAFINGSTTNQTIQTINLSATQIYTVIVTDLTTGCISQPDAVTVSITGSALAANASAVSSQLCSGNSTQLVVNASGGSGSYSYTWSSVPAGFSSSSPNPTVVPGQTTTYTVTVNDGFSTVQASTTITVFPLPGGFASGVPTTLCTGSTLQLNGIAGGGSGTGFVYTWTGPGGWTSGLQNPTITNIQLSNGGVYSLHVMDDRGCQSPVNSNVTITVNPRPTASALANPLSVCVGGTINLSASGTGGSGSYTYSWTGPSGYSTTTQNPVLSNAQTNQSGVYSLVVNDVNGCSSTNSSTVSLSVNTNPAAGATTSTPSVCIGQTIQLNATASGGSGSGYQYSWTGPGGYSSTSQFPSIPNAVLANGGTYSLVVTDGNTCSSAVSSTSITVHALPVANAGADVSIPNGTSTTLSGQGFGGTGNYSWTWTPASKINGNAFQQNIQTTNLTANQVYQLVIQDNGTSCVSNPDQITVTVSGLALGVFADATDNEVCNGVTVGLTATAFGGSGTYTYAWTSNPAGFTSSVANPTLTAGVTTTYTVLVNDGFNSVTSSTTVTVYTNPVAAASTPQPSLCTGESLLLNGSASGGSGSGYNFQWTGPNGYTSGLQNPVLSNIQSTYSGQFQLVVTDLHGCISNSSEVNVVVYSKPSANASVVDGSICPGEAISLNGLGSGGSGSGYTFSWTGPAGYSSSAQNPTISNAQSAQQGTYSLVVSDSHSCSSAASSVVVSVFSLPVVNAGLDQTIPNGTFTTLLASASGGSGNYSYAWSPVAFVVGNPNVALIQTANLSATQTFAVVATDNTSTCVSNSDNVTVFVTGGALSLSINSSSNTVCQGTSVLLTPVVSGGSGSYSYSWTSSPAGFTSALPSFAIAPSITTTYILVVNDGFNSISSSKTISVNSLPAVTLPASMGQMCIDASVLALSGGLPAGGTYSGPGVGSGLFTPSVAGAGTHVISYQYTDGNGCSKTATSPVTVYALPVVTFDNLLSPLCESAPVSIISGGMPLGGTYSGPGMSGTSFNASVAGPGNHTINYTYADINGCLSSDNNTLTVHALPVVTYNNIISPVCISASPFVLSGGNPAGGTYSGPGIAAGSLNPGLAGVGNHEIIYRYRNANNCENSDTNQILINELPLSYGITGSGSYCTGESGLTVILNGSALNTSYQLYKNGIASGPTVPGTGSSINWTLLTAGTYTVKASSLSTSCISDMTGNAIITEVSLPTVFNLGGSGTYCNGTNGKSITLSSSETGVLYQLYKNGIAEGTALTGSGSMLSWNNKLNGSYTVIATSACSQSMAGTVIITEDPLFTTAITPDPAYVIINQSISLTSQQNGGTGIYTNYAWTGPGSVYLNSTSIPNPDFLSTVVGNFTVNLEVTDSHGCIATNNLIVHVTSIVWEPLMADKSICGSGSATMLASIGPGGNEIQFSLDGINPVFTDNTAPYEYTTPLIPVGTDLTVYARARNSITGITSTWISAIASSLTGSIPGYIDGDDPNLCTNTSTGQMVLMDYTGEILRWQRRVNGGNWINISFTGEVYEEVVSQTGVVEFRAVVKLSICDEAYSVPALFNFAQPTNPGELTGTLATVCVGSSTGLMSVNNNNGVVYQWERSYNFGPWVVVSNGGATFSDVPSQPGNWNYRALVVNGVCAAAYTNIYTVGALAAPTGGTLSGGGQICFGSYTPIMILSGNTGPVLNWQRRFNSGSWVDIVNTGSWYEEIPPVAGSYSYRVLIEGYNCSDVYSSISTIQVLPQGLAGVVNGSANICLGSSTGYLTLSSYYGTIVKWQKKFESGNWTDINHFSATYQETPVSPGTWYYRALVQNGVCGLSFSSVASIGVSPPAVGGSIAGSSVICVGNSTGILSLNGYTGSILKWQRRLNGGNWTDINQQLSTFSEMLNQSGSYEYRAQVQNGGCAPVYSALGIVEVTPLTVAGVTSGTASLCYGETGPVISLSGNTGTINGWQKRLNGGSWTDIQNTGVTYQEIPVSAGTWEYRAVVKNGNCNVAYSSVTSVVVNPLPTIFSVSGNPILCAGSQGASLNLSGSQSGFGYQLYKDGIALGFPKQGTGFPLQWTGLLPGLYTVSASGTATFCFSEMQGELEITQYPLPGVFSLSVTSFDCGNLGTGGINLSGSETGISYQLVQNMSPVGLPLIGTGQEMDWISIYSGNYQIQATNQLSGCQVTMTGIAVVQGAPLPQVFTVTGGGSACQNSAGVSIGLSGSQPSIQYVLYYNYDQLGTGLTGTGQALNFGLQQSGGSYTIVGSNLNSGCRIAMNGSATVNILPAPVVELGPDIDLLYGGSVILSPQISPGLEPYTYLWTPSTALSNTSALNPVANPLNNITYTLKVTGNNNCFTTDQVTINPFLPDGQSVVSGRVTYANTPGTPLQNIPVYLKNASGAVVAQGFTNTNGEYMFQPFPNGLYTLTAGSDQSVGGINSTDALRILKQFVQIQSISGIWLKAADVDGSNYVNSIDALAVQLYFVGSINAFVSGKWVFDKIAVNFTGGIFYEEFKGLCYGDVNGSYIPYAKREETVPVLTQNILEAESGQEVTIPVYISEELKLGAVSLSLAYDQRSMEILDASMPGANEELIRHSKDGEYHISYITNDYLLSSAEKPFILLRARVYKSCSIMEVKGEFADPYAQVHGNVFLKIPGLKIKNSGEQSNLVIYPNPTKGESNLKLELLQDADVNVQLYDSKGSLVRILLTGHFTAGNVLRTADLSKLPAGMYLVKCQIDNELPIEYKIEIIP